ncbi:MAG: PIG-L deacetylase family protein [Gemmatimonadales bacterium]
MTERMLVIAPHPDDEVLGAGGLIARTAAAGGSVLVAIVTKGMSPPFDPELIATGRREAGEAHALLGVGETVFLDFPAAALDTVAHRDLNAALAELSRRFRPDTVLLPFPGDIHADHQLVFQSGLVACRPSESWWPRRVMAYETLSETNWNAPYLTPGFHPNLYVDIEAQLDTKLAAMERFASQVRPFPHERSVEALRALAALRGATVGRRAAEAFVLVRGME